jgi:frataxin-like iron-binding protein CyaY
MAFLGHKRCGLRIVVDHIDNNCLNNKLSNLQLVTQRQNTIKDMVISHKYSGVTFEKRRQKWVGRISLNNKHYNTTYFKDEDEAYLAYIDLRKRIGVDLPIRFDLYQFGKIETLNLGF